MSSPEYGSDPWLDAKLRNVPLPIGFLARLGEASEVAARYSTPERIDAALVDVPLPPGLLERLQGISRERQPLFGTLVFSTRQLALAASVLVAVGVSYLAMASGVFSPADPLAVNLPVQAPKENGIESSPDEPLIATVPQLGEDNNNNPPLDKPDLSLPPPRIELPYLGPTLSRHEPRLPAPPLPLTANIAHPEATFGAGGGLDVAPELDMVARPLSRGIVPPRTLGYDLLFQLKHGDHPFVSPAANKELLTSRVPLVTASDSYQLAWRYVRHGQLPPPEDIRTEEFLAAVDYGFASAAPGTLALRTAAGPAPLGDIGLRVLQIGVQAGPLAVVKRTPAHLTVAVDVSSGMRWSGRLEMTRRAIASLVSQLSAGDRLDVIAVGDQAEMVLENAGEESAARVQSALASLKPRPVANLAAGLEMACEAVSAAADSHDMSHQLVVLTDGSSELASDRVARIDTAMTNVAASGVNTHVIDLSREKESPSLVTALAAAGQGATVRAATSDQILWAMVEALTGRSSVVVEATSLKVTFKPDAVALYRLVGHESSTVTGPESAALEVNLRAGQSATALFEVVLKPGLGEEVATAELTWKDPLTHKPQRATQRITRLQFAKSFAESPMSLQAATLLARTAEALRGSYYAPLSPSLEQVRQLSVQVHERLAEQPQFAEFVSLVELLEKLAPRVSASRKDAGGGSR